MRLRVKPSRTQMPPELLKNKKLAGKSKSTYEFLEIINQNLPKYK
jgi:hypothetical protein